MTGGSKKWENGVVWWMYRAVGFCQWVMWWYGVLWSLLDFFCWSFLVLYWLMVHMGSEAEKRCGLNLVTLLLALAVFSLFCSFLPYFPSFCSFYRPPLSSLYLIALLRWLTSADQLLFETISSNDYFNKPWYDLIWTGLTMVTTVRSCGLLMGSQGAVVWDAVLVSKALRPPRTNMARSKIKPPRALQRPCGKVIKWSYRGQSGDETFNGLHRRKGKYVYTLSYMCIQMKHTKLYL